MDEIKSAINTIAVKNNMNELRLWDLSNGIFDLTETELRELAEYGKSSFLLPSKVAIVAPKNLEFGLSRMYEAYREEGLVKHRVFRTEQEARAWLTGQAL
ncbi:MAG: hypothetical protein OQL09_08680 [Gammaproteobacteria bacterium]|nr:hypothetical protein [Gammaproteobacteria bacterium]